MVLYGWPPVWLGSRFCSIICINIVDVGVNRCQWNPHRSASGHTGLSWRPAQHSFGSIVQAMHRRSAIVQFLLFLFWFLALLVLERAARHAAGGRAEVQRLSALNGGNLAKQTRKHFLKTFAWIWIPLVLSIRWVVCLRSINDKEKLQEDCDGIVWSTCKLHTRRH